MVETELPLALTALAVSLALTWPLLIAGWSLPDRFFNMRSLAGAPRAQLLIAAGLPSLAALWAVTIVPAYALPGTLVLAWTLICLAIIDARTYLLPDCLTFPLIAMGLGHAILMGVILGDVRQGLWAGAENLFAAGLAFAFMGVVAWAFHRWRGREGLGLGDAKLLAAAGAWLGLSALPSVLLLAAASALIVTVAKPCLATGARFDRAAPLPFGPYLAAGTWIVWLYGPLALN